MKVLCWTRPRGHRRLPTFSTLRDAAVEREGLPLPVTPVPAASAPAGGAVPLGVLSQSRPVLIADRKRVLCRRAAIGGSESPKPYSCYRVIGSLVQNEGRPSASRLDVLDEVDLVNGFPDLNTERFEFSGADLGKPAKR